MRIISGKYRGRIIKMPRGIRPTQNKVRKALFDILGDIEGLSFLELFAGSGAIGFEAISRGVAELTFVEHNRDCLLAIRKNIESLRLNPITNTSCTKMYSKISNGVKVCNLYPKKATEAIKTMHKENKKYDIIFLDPPYYKDVAKKTLQILGAYDILAPNGFLIAQHFKKDSLPEKLGDLVIIRQARYGDTELSFYKRVSRD